MAEIKGSAVMALRQKTGAGMIDCKNALVEAGGDEAQAIEILRKKGMATADKKAGRVTAEGAVGSYGRQSRRARRNQLRVGFRRARRRISAIG
jgi:elongation factor Ts